MFQEFAMQSTLSDTFMKDLKASEEINSPLDAI
jgi:hypothetical protein